MKLRKTLNLLDVFCIATGAMLSGLFILPGLAFEIAGPAVLVSYLLAGLLALTGVLSQAELASAMPKAGGTYFYVARSMGSATGTVYGLITWLSLALKSAYELLFMAIFVVVFFHINVHLLAVVFCLVFLAINMFGVKEAGRIQVYLVGLLLLVLAYFCVRAYPAMDAHSFKPFMPQGKGAILPAAGFIFVSFGGLLKIASIAEEVKNPGKTLPLAMIFSLLVITLVYLGVVFVTVAVQGEALAGAKTPLSDVAEVTMGRSSCILAVAALLAILTSANAGIMAASRYPLALARDEMIPAAFGRINHRFNTPHVSVVVTGVLIIMALFLDTKILVKAASSVLIMTFIFACVAVMILRESRVQNYQPQFRSPLYPWVQLAGIIGFLVLLFEIGVEAVLTSCLLMMGGFLVYWFYGRASASREYALLHLIERITARDITTHSLEEELKGIIHERDEILKDRFDHLIESCPVLDIDRTISVEEFFQTAATVLAQDLEMGSEAVYRALSEREKESSTVLNPFLAIPHIIIDGEKRFDVLLARCREGIVFSESAPKVHTVFVLIGTKDERPFHLLTLAAIAQIVQDPDFDRRWMDAKSAKALRDIVLLGKRKRS